MNRPVADQITAPSSDSAARRVIATQGFAVLWLGDATSRLGYQIAQFLLPLLAVTVLHSTGLKVGMVSAAQVVPVIVLSISAGALIRRVGPRGLLASINVIRCGALAGLGIWFASQGPNYWLLLATATVVGSATVFYDIGFQTTVPKMIGPNQLVQGNGILQASGSATQMAGPAAAGFVLQLVGAPLAAVVTAVLFGAAAAGFRSLRAGPSDSKAIDRTPFYDGFRIVWQCRAIRDLCLQSGIFNLHEEAFLTALLIYAVRTLGISGGVLGVLLGLASAGALVGSLVTGHLAPRIHAGAAVSGGLIAAAVSLLIGSALAPLAPLVVLAVALIVNGVAQSVYNVLVVSLRQTIPRPDQLGPVTAVYRLISFGTVPLGAMLGGGLVDIIGARMTLLAVTISMTVASVTLLRSPIRRVRSVTDAKRDLGLSTVLSGGVDQG